MNNSERPAYPIDISALLEIAENANKAGISPDEVKSNIEGCYGLSKRERFAMAAMQGLICVRSDDYWMPEEIAEDATQYADALLKELEEPK